MQASSQSVKLRAERQAPSFNLSDKIMVTTESIQQLLQESFPSAEISVAQSGSKFDVRIVSNEFEGLRSIKRQQLVYAAFGDLITSGAVHALSINAVTVDEWKQQSRFGANF